MYKPSKRMIKKGEILDRGNTFYLFGYEYTLSLKSDDEFLDRFAEWLTQNLKNRVRFSVKKEAGTMVVLFFDAKFELARHRREGDNVIYHAFFSRWMENSMGLADGDEMNKLLTGLELMLVHTDPLTWVRDMWVPRNIIGTERTFSIWDTKYPEYRFSAEYIKSKGYNNGREFEEKYLADRLRGYGVDIYGGSAVSPTGTKPSNPLVASERNDAAERMQKVKDTEEAKKIEAAKPKQCPSCGADAEKGVRFCASCGARFTLTLEEKRAEEVTRKDYPMFFIREAEFGGEPYIYPMVNEELDPVQESADGNMYSYRISGFRLSRKLNGQSGFSEVENIISHDNVMYLTESRLMVLNKKYNKNDAGSWVGFGGVTAMVVGEALNAAGRAAEAHKRKGKVYIGMLRYEWISIIRYHEKKGVMSYPTLELYYEDINKTTWCLTLYLTGNEGGAYTFADYIVHMIALHRTRMDDKKDDEMQEFIKKYSDVNEHIPLPKEEGEFVRIDMPYHYYATKGRPFCPWYY